MISLKTDKAKQLFEQYNPPSDIVRCPYGKSPLRALLDSYARAAVNLYGIIHREDLADIFNSQNETPVSAAEIYTLLLPLVYRNAPYIFYKQYVVNEMFMDAFDQTESLQIIQSFKPRYIPEKEEFLKFVHEEYVYGKRLKDLYRFLKELFGSKTETQGFRNLLERYIFVQTAELNEFTSVYQLHFSEDQLETFCQLAMDVRNNTRMWENKGYTPLELYNGTNKDIDAPPQPVKPKRIGRNDLCPCGSGKKYKKCCRMVDDLKTAQLSEAERREFFQIWMSLIEFINDRKQIIPDFDVMWSNNLQEEVYEIRTALWEEPELIDEYIRSAELPDEHVKVLKLWKTNHINKNFFLVRYEPEYAVALSTNDQGNYVLYGIKGISEPLATVLLQKLPIVVHMVLLPFKGKIIFDGLLNPLQATIDKGYKDIMQKQYDKAIEQGIITTLE